MNDAVLGFIAVVSIGASCFLAFCFGKTRGEAECERKKSESAAFARRVRRGLRDDAVVKRLHDVFKR